MESDMQSSQLVQTTRDSSFTLKRDRPPSINQHTIIGNLPPLPQLSGDRVLEIFTHKSLRQPKREPTPSSSAAGSYDNERLSELGRNVLEMAATQYLFARKPMLMAYEIAVCPLRLEVESVATDCRLADSARRYPV